MKINLSRAFLYGEPPSATTGGSDSVYRTLRGLSSWIRNNSGITNTSAQALSYSVLNSVNKSIVDKGVFPDLLVIGTDLVGSVAGIDSTVRRLLESDTKVGYTVQQITLAQGNDVRVVVDARVRTGDAFLLSSERITALPLNGRGMFVIAAVDFADARKRRCLAEWTLEVRNPQAHGFISAKT